MFFYTFVVAAGFFVSLISFQVFEFWIVLVYKTYNCVVDSERMNA